MDWEKLHAYGKAIWLRTITRVREIGGLSVITRVRESGALTTITHVRESVVSVGLSGTITRVR